MELNGFCLAILLLIYLTIRLQNKYLLDQKLFQVLLCTTTTILFLDSYMWLIDGTTDPYLRIVYLIVTALYYTLNPFICFLWCLYTDNYINRNTARIKKTALLISAPAFINMILSVASMFTNVLFYIDDKGVYHRGTLFGYMALTSLFYLMYAMIYAIVNHKKLLAKEYVVLLAFPIPPLIGGVLQSLFYGVSLIWACVTISLLLIFINFQNAQLGKDHLTGLYNRRALDSFLQSKVQGNTRKLVAGVMIDLNSFKEINDTYGHECGDRVLQYTAEILQKTFRKNDFVARFGGDEFVVIMEINSKDDLSKVIDRLHENTDQFNSRDMLPYKIDLSVGYDYASPEQRMSGEFLKHIDSLMYQDKNKSKTGSTIPQMISEDQLFSELKRSGKKKAKKNERQRSLEGAKTKRRNSQSNSKPKDK